MSKRPSEALRLLEAYTQAHGTSGHEDAVRAIFVRELRGRTLQADGFGQMALALAIAATPQQQSCSYR